MLEKSTRAGELAMVSVKLERELWDAMRNLAHENDRTLTAELRRAIRAHLAASRDEDEG
jgi:predicted transcriptional regulator